MSEKILITGGTGFIGSHLTEILVKEGLDVTVFDRYNPNNDWGWLEESEVKNDIKVVLGDIRDFDSVSKLVSTCNSVFHLAALIGIPYSYISPLAYIRTNIEGTYNILESCKHSGIDQVLITSTSETYGTAQYVPIDEEHPLIGQSPYSATKIAADQLAISYYKSFDLPVKIVRPFNTYGTRQSARAIIPTIISQLLTKKNNIELGNLSPTRDLTYVKDTCYAFLEIYKSSTLFGQPVNIGMNSEISIGDLVNLIVKILGLDIKIKIIKERERPTSSEVQRLRCNNEKLLKNTNWEAKYGIKEGLSEVIEWMKDPKNLQKYKINHYNV